VRDWIRPHNRTVKRTGRGVRLLVVHPPSKRPWLHAIEPTWVHGKRRVVEPDGLLSAPTLAARVYAATGLPPEPHLTNAARVAR
jgi:hypothetical protein